MSAKLIDVNGNVQTVVPENGKTFNLQELYKLLDCELIEVVETVNGTTMIIDEEGKLASKPINWIATRLYKNGKLDPIVGKAIVCSNDMLD